MFGQCCFDTGDIKVTMGTGSFWDINTGSKVHSSKTGKLVYVQLLSERNRIQLQRVVFKRNHAAFPPFPSSTSGLPLTQSERMEACHPYLLLPPYLKGEVVLAVGEQHLYPVIKQPLEFGLCLVLPQDPYAAQKRRPSIVMSKHILSLLLRKQ